MQLYICGRQLTGIRAKLGQIYLTGRETKCTANADTATSGRQIQHSAWSPFKQWSKFLVDQFRYGRAGYQRPGVTKKLVTTKPRLANQIADWNPPLQSGLVQVI